MPKPGRAHGRLRRPRPSAIVNTPSVTDNRSSRSARHTADRRIVQENTAKTEGMGNLESEDASADKDGGRMLSLFLQPGRLRRPRCQSAQPVTKVRSRLARTFRG